MVIFHSYVSLPEGRFRELWKLMENPWTIHLEVPALDHFQIKRAARRGPHLYLASRGLINSAAWRVKLLWTNLNFWLPFAVSSCLFHISKAISCGLCCLRCLYSTSGFWRELLWNLWMPVSSCGKPNAINNDYIPFGYILIATKKRWRLGGWVYHGLPHEIFKVPQNKTKIMDSFSIAVHGSPYGGMKLMLSLTLAEVHENTKQNSVDFGFLTFV